MAASHVAAVAIKPPERLPDLHLLLTAVLSCSMFCVAYLWGVWQLWAGTAARAALPAEAKKLKGQ